MEFPHDRREDLKNLLAVLAAILLVQLGVFLYLYRNMQMSRLKSEIRQLREAEKSLFIEVERLRLDIARSTSASRVERLFRDSLGYVPLSLSEKITTLKLPEPAASGE